MTHALYELAQSTIIQDKLRQEIQEELKRSGGKLTYDGVKSMKYLHKVFQGKSVFKIPPMLFMIALVFRDNRTCIEKTV